MLSELVCSDERGLVTVSQNAVHWGVWEAAEVWQVLVDHLGQCLLTVLCSCQAFLWQTMEVPSGSWQEGCRWVHLWGEKEAAEGTVTAAGLPRLSSVDALLPYDTASLT